MTTTLFSINTEVPERLVGMKPKPRFGNLHFQFCLLWATCLLLCLPTASIPGQDKITLTNEQWETGFHAFAQVLRKRGVEVMTSFADWDEYSEQETMLILLGGISAEDESYVRKYVANGGSALIATDTDFGPTRIAGQTFRIRGGGTVTARYSANQYQRNPVWPIIRKVEDNNMLFNGVNQIVTNLPALVELSGGVNSRAGWKTVAYFPGLNQYGFDRPFMIEHQNQNGGQLLVIPDHSVFVNGAVVVNDNLRFMLNTVDWLRAGNRTKCLFVLNRETVQPMNVSNVTLYRAPPSASETKRALEALWRNTSTQDKLELANEAMEFAQEERLLEELVESIKIDDLISPNRYLAVLLFLSAWCIIIPFIVVLVSNRKKPLEGTSADGLKPNPKTEYRRQEMLERFRAAEALFVHFFDRIGIPATLPKDVDPQRIDMVSDPVETKQMQKDIRRLQSDLSRQPIDYWTDVKVEELGRHIAQWANLYETGALRVVPAGVAEN